MAKDFVLPLFSTPLIILAPLSVALLIFLLFSLGKNLYVFENHGLNFLSVSSIYIFSLAMTNKTFTELGFWEQGYWGHIMEMLDMAPGTSPVASILPAMFIWLGMLKKK
ncbi:MAG: hypothetical protein FWG42_06865 [Clostridiales bacterium]|nr:hypothetical protein [Clostridiales bacterium]